MVFTRKMRSLIFGDDTEANWPESFEPSYIAFLRSAGSLTCVTQQFLLFFFFFFFSLSLIS